MNIRCQIDWQREEDAFLDGRYHRQHRWVFDGGFVVKASASPEIVPVPMSDPSSVDPEEAFVAALSSCHMLWFLSIAAKRGFIVESYRDNPSGEMSRNDIGKRIVSHIALRPTIEWAGKLTPDYDEVMAIHREAHEECFLANSVRTNITIETPHRCSET